MGENVGITDEKFHRREWEKRVEEMAAILGEQIHSPVPSA